VNQSNQADFSEEQMPILVREGRTKRRAGGLAIAGFLAVAVAASSTMASFTDPEYASFGDSTNGMTSGLYNLQIKQLGTETYFDTNEDGSSAPDNTAADIHAPIVLTVGQKLSPGAELCLPFTVRNDSVSTEESDQKLFLVDKNSDATLLNTLTYDVYTDTNKPEVCGGTSGASALVTGKTYTQMSSGVDLNKTLQASDTQDIFVVVKMSTSASGSDIQGKKVHLLAKVVGTSK
jgi:hypothetical protein